MANKISKHILLKSFGYHKKYLFLIVLISVLSMGSLSTYLILNETNQFNQLQNIKDTYGTYSYVMTNLSSEEVEIVKSDEHTLQCATYVSMMNAVNNEDFSFMSVDSDFFEYSNYEILKGNFPKSKDEVLVPKWYLFQLGIKSEDMVGAKIELIDPKTNRMELKIVSGLVGCHNDVFTYNNVNTSGFVIFNANYVELSNGCYNTFVISDQLKNAEKNANSLARTLHEKRKESSADYMLNYPLLHQTGNTEQGRKIQYNQQIIYYLIICILLFFGTVVYRNIIVICLFKWKKVITTYKLLGINMRKIINLLALLFSGLSLAGNLAGVLLSIVISKVLAKLSINIIGFTLSNEIVIPYGYILLTSILSVVCISVILYVNTRKWTKFTAGSMMQEHGMVANNKNVVRASLFKNPKFGCIKIAFRNVFYHYSSKVYLSLCIVACILLIFIIDIQIVQNIESKDNNKSYSYRIEVKDYYNLVNSSESEIESLKVAYKQIEDICKQCGYKVYYDTKFVTSINYPKKNLSSDFVNEITRTAYGYANMLSQSKTLEMKLAIMGYSDEMIDELAKKCKCKLPHLNEEEAIMLSRNVDKEGTGAFDICPSSEDKLTIQTLKFDESTQQRYEQNYTLLASVPELVVYPAFNENCLCLIINHDEFNKWFNNDYVSSFYLEEVDDSTLGKIQEVLAGNTAIKLVNQKEEYAKQIAAYQQRIIILCGLLVLICLFTILNVQLQSIFDFDSRIYEFNLLVLLGMSKLKRNLIMIIESSFIFFIGIILGFITSKLLLIYSYKIGLIHSSAFSVNLILGPILIIVLFMLLSAYFTCKRHIVRLRDME